MKEIIGEVWENEDMGDSCRNYMEVTDYDSKDQVSLDEILFEFEGKKVKITIEVIET